MPPSSDRLASTSRQLVHGGAWIALGKGVGALSGAGAAALLARLLPPDAVAAWFLAGTLIGVGANFAQLGLGQAVVPLVARAIATDDPRRARAALIAVLRWGAVGIGTAGLCYALLGPQLGSRVFSSPDLGSVGRLVALWLVARSTQLLLGSAHRALKDLRSVAVFGGLLFGPAQVAALALLFALPDGASLALAIGLSAALEILNAGASAFVLHRSARALPPGPPLAGRELLGLGAPLLGTQLAFAALQYGDLWILGIFRPGPEVALYGAAAWIVRLLSAPLALINAVVPPFITELHATGRRDDLQAVLRTAATASGLPALAILAVLGLAGGPLMGVVFGDFFRAGAPALALLAAGQATNVLAGSCGLTLIMTGHHTVLLRITVFTAVAFTAGALGAVQAHGMVGVAAVAAAAMMLQNALMLGFARARVGVWTHAAWPTRRGIALLWERLRPGARR